RLLIDYVAYPSIFFNREQVLKSQRLWKAYVDQECNNAGSYIGSPMYSYCPMQEYAARVKQLEEYVN
ncbi:lysozyme inhibitor LprI family protein, partial [Acinetobacter baumannii]|uniref:lysozyme inhibitor LprI family protein n=1 Tax=Acinetobacter baumannii TaxID=470 RepID=UPI0012E11731